MKEPNFLVTDHIPKRLLEAEAPIQQNTEGVLLISWLRFYKDAECADIYISNVQISVFVAE